MPIVGRPPTIRGSFGTFVRPTSAGPSNAWTCIPSGSVISTTVRPCARYSSRIPSSTTIVGGCGGGGRTSTGFSGFTTDVEYDPTTLGVSHPLIALRSSAPGNDVTFDKFSAFSIAPGEQTNYMTDKTNATGYADTGSTTITGIINGQFVSGTVTTWFSVYVYGTSRVTGWYWVTVRLWVVVTGTLTAYV